MSADAADHTLDFEVLLNDEYVNGPQISLGHTQY